MAIDISSFKTRNALENFSIRFANEQTDFISDEVAVPFVIPKAQFKKYQYDLSNLKSTETQKAYDATADQVDYGVFTSDGTAKLHKLAGKINPEHERDADAAVGDIRQDTAATIMEKLLLSREIALVTKVSTAASYPSGLTSTLSAGSTWADAGGDPEADASTARIAVKGMCGKVPNALALSWTALEKLKQSAALKDRLKYTSGQSLTEEQIKNLLGVQYLHVCKAQKNTADQGAADAISDVWDDFALFYVKNPAQGRRTMTYMRNFVVGQLYTHEWTVDDRGGPAGRIKMLEMGWEYTLEAAAVVSSSDSDFVAGYLLDNVY